MDLTLLNDAHASVMNVIVRREHCSGASILLYERATERHPGIAADIERMVSRACQAHGIAYTLGTDHYLQANSDSAGYHDPRQWRIGIRETNGPRAIAATAVHELTHALDRSPSQPYVINPRRYWITEVYTELTTWVTCHHFGMDTHEASHRYMATYLDGLLDTWPYIEACAAQLVPEVIRAMENTRRSHYGIAA